MNAIEKIIMNNQGREGKLALNTEKEEIPSSLVLETDTWGVVILKETNLGAAINEFSNFARMPATKPVPNDIHVIIEETIKLYREAHKNIAFTFHKGNNIGMLSLDKDQMKRAMINLLDNAVVSMENAGEVTITTSYNDALELVTIEIADTGAGIPPELKSKALHLIHRRQRSSSAHTRIPCGFEAAC